MGVYVLWIFILPLIQIPVEWALSARITSFVPLLLFKVLILSEATLGHYSSLVLLVPTVVLEMNRLFSLSWSRGH